MYYDIAISYLNIGGTRDTMFTLRCTCTLMSIYAVDKGNESVVTLPSVQLLSLSSPYPQRRVIVVGLHHFS